MSGEARSDCTCGERWTLVRFFNVRRAPSRALAELRQRHEDEYQMLLHEHREAELATAEEEWAEHVAEHGLVAANFGRSEIPA